jgi:hypothetical protein
MNDVTEPQALGNYWKQQVEAWKLSGLSQNQFCKTSELPYHRFVYWRSKFEGAARGHSTKKGSGGFAAVNYQSDGDHGLTLSLPNGFVVRGICAENLPVVRQLLDQL